jgi:2-polyprenyl-6-methoxyphenol hydroxylase-like FAD-dependent oxidoreductase
MDAALIFSKPSCTLIPEKDPMPRRQSIAIVGAGIGGLAAAALLAPRHDVTLYDQFPEPRPVGSGLVIQPVGQSVLHLCGAGAEADALGAHIIQMQGDEAGGRRILDVRYDRPGGPLYGLAIHRAALFGALHRAAQAQGVAIRPSSRMVSAPQDGAQRWLLDDAGTKHGPFDLVVDAAGAGSALSPLQARPLPYGAIWGAVPWPEGTDLPKDELRQRYRAASRMAGVLPLGRMQAGGPELAAIFWSLPRPALDLWPQQDIAEWKDQVTTLWPAMAPFLATIRSTADMTPARYGHGTLRRPFAPALVHIGDAAHRASPQLGQGANMALLDALALAHALRDAPEDPGPAYAQMRRWHVRLYQGMSWAFTPQYQSDSRVLPALRDHLLAPVARVWPVRGILGRLVRGDLIPALAGQRFP